MAVHNAQLHASVNELNKDIRVAFIVGEFNEGITQGLLSANKALLEKLGFTHIDEFFVPGAMEIPAITRMVAQKGVYNLIITLGCVIRGSTPHFDYVCQGATQGFTQVSIDCDVPMIFGVLTCDTMEQAEARVNENYAIYGLNYLASRTQADHTSDQRYQELMERAQELFDDLPPEE